MQKFDNEVINNINNYSDNNTIIIDNLYKNRNI